MNTEMNARNSPRAANTIFWLSGTIAFVVSWFALYGALAPLSIWVVSLLPMTHGSRLEGAATFFVYETPKVLMLLTLIIFVMGVIRTLFSPERTRNFLAGKHEGIGNIAAAGLGIATPFCSCSAVPMFLGFVSAGVPLGVTFSFLISAPMVNEVALGLLFALLGWKVAFTYLTFGLAVAIVAGWIIGQLHLEGWLEEWVRTLRATPADISTGKTTISDRIKAGLEAVKDIVGKTWIWIMVGIGVGAIIHGYIPANQLVTIMGRDAPWWSVPAVVIIAIPIYANAAAMIPIVEALLSKGAMLGTTLAFMMSVTALSFPETVILRKVLTIRLIAVFVGVVGIGIIVVGYLFNALFS